MHKTRDSFLLTKAGLEANPALKSGEQSQNAADQSSTDVEKYAAEKDECGDKTENHEQHTHLWVVL